MLIIKILFLPFYLVLRVLRSNKKILSKILYIFLTLLIIAPAWLLAGLFGYGVVDQFIINRPYLISVAGTGSMYPTFPKGSSEDPVKQARETVAQVKAVAYPNGIELNDKRYFFRELERGDIVSFSNSKTEEILKKENSPDDGFLKRIIGLPGDELELRGGLVLINGQPLIEPYTDSAHSTFGGTYLEDCEKLKIPQNKYFVMGDNRKASNDSREDIGLVDEVDIKAVITNAMQEDDLKKHWRDTSLDLDDSTKIKLNKDTFLKLVNKYRQSNGLEDLKHDPRLDSSAQIRAEAIIRTNDLSFEGVQSGVSVRSSMSSSNYSNITWGEIPVRGYYTAEELVENIFAFPNTKDFILNKDFQDIGISSYEGDLMSCPTQYMVIHVAGYVPPDYPVEQVNNIRTLLSKLQEVKPGWESLKKYPDYYEQNKKKVDRINELILVRINNLSGILTTIEENKWLSADQEAYLKRDPELSEEQQRISEELNAN